MSWYGEARVHQADAVARGVASWVPSKSWQKLLRSWLYWRFAAWRTVGSDVYMEHGSEVAKRKVHAM